MDDLRELLEVSSNDALQFFYSGLRNTPPAKELTQEEGLHVASVLASFTQISCGCEAGIPAPRTLSDIFDSFILDTSLVDSKEHVETAGAQSLLLAGFFRDQMKHRHNVRWYEKLGQGFYAKASSRALGPKQRTTFRKVSENFPTWTLICRDLQRNLRDDRLLLKLH